MYARYWHFCCKHIDAPWCNLDLYLIFKYLNIWISDQKCSVAKVSRKSKIWINMKWLSWTYSMSVYETKVYRDISFSYIFPIISHHKFHILSTEGGWLTLFSSHILDLMRKRTTNRDVQSGRPQFHLYFRILRQSFPSYVDLMSK